MDNYELIYYRNICEIKDDFINERISKTEYERKIEIERLKFIEYLQRKNIILRAEKNKKSPNTRTYKNDLGSMERIGFKGD